MPDEAATPKTRTPSFVARNQRERLVLAFVELVMERGYDNVRLADVAGATGVGLGFVSAHFVSEEECALAAADIASQQMFTAASRAFLSTSGDCVLAARAALDAILRFFAGAPAFVHLSVVEYSRIGTRAIAARQRAMALFAEFLGPGFAVAGDLPPQREVLSMLIAGGIYEILSKYYLEGRLQELPEALPAIAYFTVAPFFGLDEARRVASLPPSTVPLQ